MVDKALIAPFFSSTAQTSTTPEIDFNCVNHALVKEVSTCSPSPASIDKIYCLDKVPDCISLANKISSVLLPAIKNAEISVFKCVVNMAKNISSGKQIKNKVGRGDLIIILLLAAPITQLSYF